MDVLAVREAVRFAIDYCSVQKKGPLVFEIKTYRYHGHSMSDPGISYREKSEVQEVRASRDPLEIVKKMIVDQKWSTEEELKQIEKDIRKKLD